MSLLDETVEAYAEAQTTPAAEHLRMVARETADELGSTAMLTGPVEGRLLETLVFATQPQLVLEIGTFSGYSALSMVPALPDGGRIVTCELDDEHADFAQRHIDAVGAGERIEIRRGPALDSIAALDGPFDLVFIDADKAGIPEYFRLAHRLSRPGTIIVVDNVVRRGAVLDATSSDPDVQGVRRFNELVALTPGVSATTIQTVGAKGYDGFALALVTAPP